MVTLASPGAAILRRRAGSVARVSREVRELLADMLEIMYASNGVGLAAPQVGVGVRAIVADAGRGPLLLVNPRITRRSGRQVGIEGCLSVPGVVAEVERWTKVVVRARNRRGWQVEVEAEDLMARVLQHEIDHLNGILFLDRADRDRIYALERAGDGRESPLAGQSIIDEDGTPGEGARTRSRAGTA
ncbi:MAG: peptide deformylase [Armatimonadetes bacterium]|nr:peptide deformylase [Armatimonadota bacterium]